MPKRQRNQYRRREDDVIEITLTQGQVALIDSTDLAAIKTQQWCARRAHHTWYAYTHWYGDDRRTILAMHQFLMNAPKGLQTDHINLNGLDNRRHNLRLATPSQNHANQRKSRGSMTSRFKGVRLDKRRNNWTAQIKVNYKFIYLGAFDTEVEAAQAYNVAALHHFGEFARLNEME